MSRKVSRVNDDDIEAIEGSVLYKSAYGYIGPKDKALAHQGNQLNWTPKQLSADGHVGVDPKSYEVALPKGAEQTQSA